MRRALPDRPLAPIGKHSADELWAAVDHLDAWSLHCHRRLAAAVVAARGERATPVLAYTVNEAEEARRLLEIGVDGLFTDAPGRLRRELAA